MNFVTLPTALPIHFQDLPNEAHAKKHLASPNNGSYVTAGSCVQISQEHSVTKTQISKKVSG